MSSAWIERSDDFLGIIRVGQDGAKHHDKYHLAATIRRIGKTLERVEVCGLADPNLRCACCGELVEEPTDRPAGISRPDWKAMAQALKAIGVKWVLTTRSKLIDGEQTLCKHWWEL